MDTRAPPHPVSLSLCLFFLTLTLSLSHTHTPHFPSVPLDFPLYLTILSHILMLWNAVLKGGASCWECLECRYISLSLSLSPSLSLSFHQPYFSHTPSLSPYT